MKELIDGLCHFHNQVFERKRALFQSLEHEQHPKALFITCADSRVDPTLMTQCEPGELFVLRNAGNIVPPKESGLGVGQEATVNYAVHHLKVEHIIICGHTNCGAMKALVDTPEDQLDPIFKEWLACAHPSDEKAELYKTLKGCDAGFDEGDDAYLFAAQLNVKQQLVNLMTLPAVKEAVEAGKVKLHGWVFCLSNADVQYLNQELDVFEAFELDAPGDTVHQRTEASL